MVETRHRKAAREKQTHTSAAIDRQAMEEQGGSIEEQLAARLSLAKYFSVSSTPYILNSLFLFLLVYKMQFAGSECSWMLVFAPFVAADAWTMVLRRNHSIDGAGSALTKIGACMYMSGYLPSFAGPAILCLPLWTSLVFSTYYRCLLSSQFSSLIRTFYQVIIRGVQPFLLALQLDGANADWVVVLTPAWTLLVICFSGALFLIYCAPVLRLHSLHSLQAEATILIFLCCLYLLCISLGGFLFLFW